jgi:hypothetical protein
MNKVENILKKLLIWSGQDFVHYSLANLLQEDSNFELFGLIDDAEIGIKKFYKTQNLVKFSKLWNYYDFIKNDIDVDQDYLKNFEKKWNINLWDIIYTERFFYSDFNSFHNFSKTEMLSIIQHECKLFEQILEEVKPDYFLTNMITRHPKLLLHLMCEKLGIPSLMLETARFGNRLTISKTIAKIDNPELYTQIKNPFIKSHKDLEKYIEKYKRGTGSLFGTQFTIPKIKKLVAMGNFLINPMNEHNQKIYLNKGKTKFSIIKKSSKFFREKRRKTNETFLDTHCIKKIDDSEDFVYFPLHSEPEREILIQSRYNFNQIVVATNVAKSLPMGMMLYVKEHPVMRDEGWRDIEYYKQFLKLPNVKLIHPLISSHDLIKKCKIAMTISGDVGLEAALYKKPSIVFSDVDYAVIPSVFRVENFENLSNIIEKALSIEIDSKSFYDYVSYIHKNSFEFKEWEYLIDFQNTFHYLGFNQEQSISSSEMKKFLGRHKSKFQSMLTEHLKKFKNYDDKEVVLK